MRDYPLHPGLRTFWVDLQRERLKAIEPGGRIILDNPNDGRYEIPFSAISKYFQLDDPAIYKWTMYLTARATQPNFFTILSKKMLPDGRRENTVIVDDFDASKYFVSDLEKAKSNEEPEMLVFDTSQTKSAEAEIEAEIDTSSRFEMENELEGFLAQNWSTIFPEWEKMGRQVPAGDAGRMDFLGKHKTSGHFQVWELKRGESDDAALAQVLRYMGYITKNMAGGDKSKVSGAIICLTQGEGLKLAVSQLDGRVTVLEYQVKFNLKPAAILS
ncbi:MAG TPA: hypothetical protein VNE86_03400 [Nitrososphaerales archaeon]|nr:hypothetical protein [Nitrososphaerales archaeon]